MKHRNTISEEIITQKIFIWVITQFELKRERGRIRKLRNLEKTMKTIHCAIVTSVLLLSVVLCQLDDEDYADVNCQYQWGGVVCDCERLKYVNDHSICSSTIVRFS